MSVSVAVAVNGLVLPVGTIEKFPEGIIEKDMFVLLNETSISSTVRFQQEMQK